jgi:hypothetical protein
MSHPRRPADKAIWFTRLSGAAMSSVVEQSLYIVGTTRTSRPAINLLAAHEAWDASSEDLRNGLQIDDFTDTLPSDEFESLFGDLKR